MNEPAEASLSRSSTRSTAYTTCPPSPTLSDSNSSLIFERNVEDPCLMTQAHSPQEGFSKHGSTTSLLSRHNSNQFPGLRSRGSTATIPHSPLMEGQSPEYVMPSLDHRRTLENFVAPALDAGCCVVTDDNADLDDMDIVYMKRPSTMGLDMALGRTKSNSSSTITSANQDTQQTVPQLSLSRSYSNSTNNDHTRTLRFYSYADMLSDEMAQTSPNPGRKPSLGYSLSSSHIKSSPQQRPSVVTNFSNPFIKRRDSATATQGGSKLTRRYSNTLLSRSPPQPRAASQRHGNRSARSNFHIDSSGSDELSTDEDEDPHHQSLPPPASQPPAQLMGPRISRANTQGSSSAGCSPLFVARSYSNTGPPASLGSPSIIRRRESSGIYPQPSINNVLMHDDTLQVEKVGEVLKRRASNRKDNL